jgi:hypothetical protein
VASSLPEDFYELLDHQYQLAFEREARWIMRKCPKIPAIGVGVFAFMATARHYPAAHRVFMRKRT